MAGRILQATVPPILGNSELERLVNRSRLSGADPTLVVHGGGNTSSKTREIDHLGRERDVLRIKGSGTDLKTIGPDGFPGLYHDELRPLRGRAAMTDEEMVDYLARCMVEPGSRRPSIETLLHAFLPTRHVDHVHADAICALTNTPDAARHVREALGPDVAIVPYIRPGFALSRQVADLAEASAVVLAKHGLVTWGETHEASYGRTLELVARAEAYLAQWETPSSPAAPDLDEQTTASLMLTLRGLLSGDGRRVLHVDRTQRRFADRSDVDLVATAARATPDHVLRIGAKSLVLHDLVSVADAVAAFAASYREYYARHQHRLPPGLGMLSPLPKVVLVPGLGCIAAGPDARTARVNAEIAARSHRVTARVRDAFGEVDWLSEEEIFAFDYWFLELYKLQSALPAREFSGHVVMVTGADSTVGGAVVTRLVGEGAHVVLAGGDAGALQRLATSLPGERAHVAVGEPVNAAIEAFGGVDTFVALDPSLRGEESRFAAALDQQGMGGAVVGLASSSGSSIDLDQTPGEQVRKNLVHVADGADPSLVAAAMAFLASPRAAATDGASLPVGPAPE